MAGAPDSIETKHEQIRRFLFEGEFPSTYNKSERFNFKLYCAKFTLKDGEIYCGQRQVVKSEEEALTHFREAHMPPIGGHSGFNKTCSALSSRWFWHGMTKYVRKWVQECDKCQKVGRPPTAPEPLQGTKIRKRQKVGRPPTAPQPLQCKKIRKRQKVERPPTAPEPLQCIKVSAVWELVGIDLAGPYPTTKDGYQYIFTATDYFSKWVEAFPLRTKTAVEVSEQICNLIYQHGFPQRILSDQGEEFVSQLNEHVCEMLGIRSVTAVYHHPWTNALDDETNHNIKRALTKLVNDRQNNWDTYLKPTIFSLRSKVQTTTNFSPFLLMYGREAVFPSPDPLELPLNIILPEKETYERFVEEKKASSELQHKKAVENIEKTQGRQEDARAGKVFLKYSDGDEVKMSSAPDLFQCGDPEKWRRVSDVYWGVVAAKGAKKKELVELDRWYQEALPARMAAQSQKSLTLEELERLMEWKLTRGKFRPRLKQMVASNPAGAVESCTRRAFQLLPDVSAAIEELCQLKGIGPATASAVLAAGAPELAAFMADEAVESVPGLSPIQYNVKHYLRYLREIQLKSDALSKASKEKWTPHRVELCLWTWKVAQKLCPELLESVDDEEEERPVKKLKTKR